MDRSGDARTVLTLDAGGTHFVFGAIRGQEPVVEPLTRPSHGADLAACLAGLVDGFREVGARLPAPPVAISFAFPGPADYPAGIIGDLGNLPAFRGGVALGPLLEERFGLPVFIHNDGDLFACGEALAGLLPWVNARLAQAGSPKRFRNLLGVTLGTGFGGGIVSDGRLLAGDNSGAGEIWLLRNKLDHEQPAEEGVSIRAVRRAYAAAAGLDPQRVPEPREIAAIGLGQAPGDREAAREAFRRLGEVAGDAIANATTLVDGLVAVGGGLAGAAPLFLPALVAEMNAPLRTPAGGRLARLEVTAFDLEDPAGLQRFLAGERREVAYGERGRTVVHDALRRVGVGLSRLGTSRAVSIGAYAFALDELDRRAGARRT